ncbi:hypothetical protein GCK72_019765 [Caenorhabditis remanei]|uniref:Uncharacterized protein n=1 Tax=Caenorhabditis remanei TaxID=31234 RepID=A0A6A5GFL9_CAERE|nr:hypothetical protein GCK72_019765 [Caenorhabditis remanei]KAF1753209.1 hypothetical protein GCK72_019765 [Caenorhabditis remanei]
MAEMEKEMLIEIGLDGNESSNDNLRFKLISPHELDRQDVLAAHHKMEKAYALHKYRKWTVKTPKPSYEERIRDDIKEMRRNGEDPADYYILEPGFEEMPENLEPDRKSKSGDVSIEQSPEFVHQRDEISEEEDLEEEEEHPTNLNNVQILLYRILEDEQDAPIDSCIGQQTNVIMKCIRWWIGQTPQLIFHSYRATHSVQKTSESYEKKNRRTIDGTDKYDDFDPDSFQNIDIDQEEDLAASEIDTVEMFYEDEHDAEPSALGRKNDGVKVQNVGQREFQV